MLVFRWSLIDERIQRLTPKSSPGLDELDVILVKQSCSGISAPLSNKMSLSFGESDVPNGWLIASEVPVYEEGNKLDQNNYRPISLVGEIMECIIFNLLC